MNIHIFIVTGQAQANLIPILQLKPDLIVLAVSSSMAKQADEFIKILKKTSRYQDKDILKIIDVPDVGIERITDKALEIEDALQEKYPESCISYHATGGTKLMTLGFYEVFRASKHTVLYCDMTHNEIETVYPEHQPALMIESVLDIYSALLSMGQTYRTSSDQSWEFRADERKELTKWLATHSEKLSGGFFGTLNGMVQKAIKRTKRGEVNKIEYPEQTFQFRLGKAWQAGLEKMNQHQVCQWDKNKVESIYFDSLGGAEYIGGQWLEEYVWHIAKDLQAAEVMANVEFAESGALKDDIRNEMDCIILHNNRLLFIECKTISFKKSVEKNTDIVYKLESLGHRAGGQFSTKWLVSANEVDEPTKKRAQEYNIEIIEGKELKNIKQRIQYWMQSG